MWLHFMFDLSGLLLLFVLFASSSSSLCFWLSYPCSSLTTTYSQFDTSCASSLRISLSDHFSSLFIIVIIFTLGTFRFKAHELLYTWGHGFFIIGYLSLVSLHFCYPITLAYVMSCVLRPPWGHEIRCHLRQPLLGLAYETWLMFRYHHASSFGRHFFDVWVRFNCGFGLPGLHVWRWMIWCHLIFRPIIRSMPY